MAPANIIYSLMVYPDITSIPHTLDSRCNITPWAKCYQQCKISLNFVFFIIKQNRVNYNQILNFGVSRKLPCCIENCNISVILHNDSATDTLQ